MTPPPRITGAPPHLNGEEFRRRELIRGPERSRPYFFLAAPLAGVASAGLAPDDLVPAATPEPVMPKRSLKRCTRPPRSTLWRTPVHAGWVFGSISRRICAPSLPQVDLVSKVVPSVITTVILW